MRQPLLTRLLLASFLVPSLARAHDIQLPLSEIERGTDRLSESLRFFQTRPAIPGLPQTRADHQRLLGQAEVELAMGKRDRALEILMGRLADARFRELPEYLPTLLLTSQILESMDEGVGAMYYAELALRQGGTPDQMAEAGARWFRLARAYQRMDRTQEILALWRQKGGEAAAGNEAAAQARYQVAFGLREAGLRDDAQRLLAQVPSVSAFGSRAAYLAGVLFVESGDLASAERWFGAVMDWALPALEKEDPQLAIEIEVRELAALSAGRLRYERGDLAGADEAYGRVGGQSDHAAEACWERAYLDLEREHRRAALLRVQCVQDLGAKGSRYVDAQLFKASLLAHLSRYADSISAYEHIFQKISAEHQRFAEAAATLSEPAEFLFAGMERNVADQGKAASPGPATIFADAWTGHVDQAFRVDRGLDQGSAEAAGILNVVKSLEARLARSDAFAGLEFRRQNLRNLIREIHHLEGHGGQLQITIGGRQASNTVALEDHHQGDLMVLKQRLDELRALATEAEVELARVDTIEAERRRQALELLGALGAELQTILSDVAALETEAQGPVNDAARAALAEIQNALQDAAMRAEFGVLDTFWLKKEHHTRQVEKTLDAKNENERLFEEAAAELGKDDPID